MRLRTLLKYTITRQKDKSRKEENHEEKTKYLANDSNTFICRMSGRCTDKCTWNNECTGRNGNGAAGK